MRRRFRVIVIGGGHAGVEAAWAAANLLASDADPAPGVALVTLDPSKTGVMSCNPAIGGLAKGQIVREVDALGGLMGMAADATGIQFKVLNTSKGPAVHGPRAQCDKHAYAEAVQRLVHARPEIQVVAGAVDELVVRDGRVQGVRISASQTLSPETLESRNADGTFANAPLIANTDVELEADAVVLTTGTFMRGLMHTGESQTPGGRVGEGAAVGISKALLDLGFELGRLKTGTPPRLDRKTIDWASLEPALGDDPARAFSDLSDAQGGIFGVDAWDRFPVLDQVDCRITRTNEAVHDVIRANLDRAPMFTGQIESAGPRYCPSIEDKVVRFADRDSHHVFLEPESLRDDWVYCNGVSTSLPSDVQDAIVQAMPGCERATILRYGYAVEYDSVMPHQINADTMTKLVEGLFLAGQINGTSGYEEAAAQGVIAGISAASFARGEPTFTLGRDQAYIGVLMDDLVTKTPVEPYRMFTSRAEHRLVLRADNAADRLTPIADRLGLLDATSFGQERRRRFEARRARLDAVADATASVRVEGRTLAEHCRRAAFTVESLVAELGEHLPEVPECVVRTVHTDHRYEAYIARANAEIRRRAETEHRRIPADVDYASLPSLRNEARHALDRFRPATLGQASRLEGITPADVTLLAVLLGRR